MIVLFCIQGNTSDWVCFKLTWRLDPVILSIEKQGITLIDSNSDTFHYRINEITDDSLQIIDGSNIIGIVSIKKDSLLFYQEGSMFPLTYYSFNLLNHTSRNGTKEIKDFLKGGFKTSTSNKALTKIEFDFISYQIVLSSSELINEPEKVLNIGSYSIIEYDSLIFLRLFNSEPRIFIVKSQSDNKLFLESIFDSQKTEVVFEKSTKESKIKDDFINKSWIIEEFKKNSGNSLFTRNIANYDAFKLSEDEFRFYNNNNSFYGNYYFSDFFDVIIFDELRGEVFQISKISKDEFKLIGIGQSTGSRMVLTIDSRPKLELELEDTK